MWIQAPWQHIGLLPPTAHPKLQYTNIPKNQKTNICWRTRIEIRMNQRGLVFWFLVYWYMAVLPQIICFFDFLVYWHIAALGWRWVKVGLCVAEGLQVRLGSYGGSRCGSRPPCMAFSLTALSLPILYAPPPQI